MKDQNNYFSYNDIQTFCIYNEFECVPFLDMITYDQEKHNVEYFQNVVRPKIPFKSNVLNKNFSFKIINCNY